jgi:UDP-N-acetylmuramyl pentapeptide phosphotransferase/UDP-N-acetylglucosamine-1-phosphate transferase
MTQTFWLVLLTALLTSFGVSALLVLTQRWHGRLSLDHDLDGAQKFHEVPVPRVGGLGLMAGLLAGAWVYNQQVLAGEPIIRIEYLAACGLPAFLFGLLEDMTKKVSVLLRLLATFASAGLAVWAFGAQLTRLDTFGLDALMVYAPVAILFTCFAVGGVANAVNIMDGFNGLASGSVAIMLIGLGGLAYLAQDTAVMSLCLVGAAAMVGFMGMNYPFGKIFLGDGGAYLAGFWLAECAVLLLSRNPSVSTWAVLLACIYPVFETVFSMWRKDIYRKTGMGKPDKLHFHMLVFRRLIGQHAGHTKPAWLRHGLTSMFIWGLVVACQLLTFELSRHNQSSPVFSFGLIAFCFVYVALYRQMVLGCYPTDDLVEHGAVQAS